MVNCQVKAYRALERLGRFHGDQQRRVMITFFADVDMAAGQPWVREVQYFGARGFFPDHRAQPELPLTQTQARIWIEAALADQHGGGDPWIDSASSLDRAAA